MTRSQIIAGLQLLIDQTASDKDHIVPAGWSTHEWAYVNGIAAAELLRLIDRLMLIEIKPGT